MDPLLYAREHDLDRQLSRRRGDRMRRRDLLAGWLAATMASALRAAGPNKVYRLAFVSSVADPSKTGQYEPLFVERRPGYVEVGRFSAKTDFSRYDTTV